MSAPYRYVEVERHDDTCHVRLRYRHLAEAQQSELFTELQGLVNDEGCRRLALSLSDDPEFLDSVFLAKLITLQRVLNEHGGELRLCHVSPQVRSIFRACKLDQLFHFAADFEDT
jgi:anti-anti-sigma factor